MHWFRSLCRFAGLLRSVTRPRLIWAFVLTFAALIYAAQPASAQFIQQGQKLVGTGISGAAEQGYSVALSADGNTLLVGGPGDGGVSSIGAAWVFTRSGGVWTQQGGKLVGTGYVVLDCSIQQGWSVALSADGNTAIIGAPFDSCYKGAAWVFARSGGVWTQQGSKLVGTGAANGFLGAEQGWSVALSADGNTAVVGGPGDNTFIGAAWVFTRSSGIWAQQGSKLVGSGGSAGANQGQSVALSADGNTLIVGGPSDNSQTGAAWVFAQSGGVWSQQGAKLVGNGAVGTTPKQGQSVALSADGNTAIVGGKGDNSDLGAAWVFARSGSAWSQQGDKLVGTGNAGNSQQGTSVGLSADGNTAIIGGPLDNSGQPGAAWLFGRSTNVWTQMGSTLVGTGASGTSYQGQSVALSGDGKTAAVGGHLDDSFKGAAWIFTRPLPTNTHDFNGDRLSDILWRRTNGSMSTWQMNANGTHTAFNFGAVDPAWQIAGTTSLVASTGDVDGAGKSDIFWRHTNGSASIWTMNGGTSHTPINLGLVPTAWQIAGIGDFDGDGHADILWRNTNGNLSIWKMNANGTHTALNLGTVIAAWQVAGIGDVNHDGKADIIWRHTNGSLLIWQMNGGASFTPLNLGSVITAWQIVGVGDVDGDGNADIVWRHTNGSVSVWKMNGATHTALNLGAVSTDWQIVSTGDYDGDSHADILWRHSNGSVAIWKLIGNGTYTPLSLGSVATAWTIVE